MASYDEGDVITSEGGIQFVVPEGVRMRKDLIYEFNSKKRTAAWHLLFGRLASFSREQATHYYCGVVGCGASYSKGSSGKGHATSCKAHASKHPNLYALMKVVAKPGEGSRKRKKVTQGSLLGAVRLMQPYDEKTTTNLDSLYALFVGSSPVAERLSSEPLFRYFVNQVSLGRYTLPDRNKVSEAIHTHAAKLRQFVAEEIGTPLYAALALDGVTGYHQAQQNLCLNATYISDAWKLETVRLGSPVVEGAHNGLNLAQCVQKYMATNLPALWSVVHVFTTDTTANMPAMAREIGAAWIPGFMHSVELCLQWAEDVQGCEAAKDAFDGLRGVAATLNRSTVARGLWTQACDVAHAEPDKLLRTATTARYFSTCELLTQVITEQRNTFTTFVALVQANKDSFSKPPSWAVQRVRKAGGHGTTASRKFIDEEKKAFYNLAQPVLEYIVERERWACTEDLPTQAFVPFMLYTIIQRLAEFEKTANLIPNASGAKKVYSSWVGALYTEFAERFWNDTQWNRTTPAFYLPAAFVPVFAASNFAAWSKQVPDAQKEATVKALRSEIEREISLLQSKPQADAVLPVEVVPTKIVDDYLGGLGVADEEMQPVQVPPEVTVDSVLADFQINATQYCTQMFDGIQHALKSCRASCDRSVFNFYRQIEAKQDLWAQVMCKLAKKWLCIAASQAATERMGSILHYLTAGNRSRIEQPKIQSRMFLRNSLAYVYGFAQATLMDLVPRPPQDFRQKHQKKD